MEATEQKVNRSFWSPSVTSQFRICPIPFHFDTYRGCSYGCLFCFARDFIEFSRRNRAEGERQQSFLEGNDPKGLRKWIDKVKAMDYDYTKAATVAFKERIVVKIGATADPFPMIEKRERITYECLKVFGEEDYPVQISTKNPEVFLEYADEFIGSNIALNVSCSFLDDDTARQIECSAISPTRRFEAIRKLSEMGFKVTVRMQPFILPYSEDVADRFIAKLKEIGAWAYQTEGLKLRVAMSDKEKAVYKKIGDVLGFDILADFKGKGSKEGGDMVYSEDDKRRMLQLLQDLSVKHGVRFYNADNLVDSRRMRFGVLWDGVSQKPQDMGRLFSLIGVRGQRREVLVGVRQVSRELHKKPRQCHANHSRRYARLHKGRACKEGFEEIRTT